MTLTTTSFDWVRSLVHRESAIVLAPGKEYLVEARLLPIARSMGLPDVGQLVDSVRSRPSPENTRKMVERTRAGRFSQLEVNRGLPAPMLVRHFTRAGSEWQVSPGLRRMVTASECNLAAPLPRMGPFDVVYLRNVLIYFDLPTKQAILRRVRELMRPDGWLFLGAAETTLGVDDSWERVVIGRSSAYRPLKGA